MDRETLQYLRTESRKDFARLLMTDDRKKRMRAKEYAEQELRRLKEADMRKRAKQKHRKLLIKKNLEQMDSDITKLVIGEIPYEAISALPNQVQELKTTQSIREHNFPTMKSKQIYKSFSEVGLENVGNYNWSCSKINFSPKQPSTINLAPTLTVKSNSKILSNETNTIKVSPKPKPTSQYYSASEVILKRKVSSKMRVPSEVEFIDELPDFIKRAKSIRQILDENSDILNHPLMIGTGESEEILNIVDPDEDPQEEDLEGTRLTVPKYKSTKRKTNNLSRDVKLRKSKVPSTSPVSESKNNKPTSLFGNWRVKSAKNDDIIDDIDLEIEKEILAPKDFISLQDLEDATIVHLDPDSLIKDMPNLNPGEKYETMEVKFNWMRKQLQDVLNQMKNKTLVYVDEFDEDSQNEEIQRCRLLMAQVKEMRKNIEEEMEMIQIYTKEMEEDEFHECPLLETIEEQVERNSDDGECVNIINSM